jgi:SAM-dependent methyltransferase
MKRELEMIETSTAFERLYRLGVPLPWDLNGPTPFVRELEERGLIRGDVLDAGCGTGENALYLAACNYRVIALDGAPSAIEKARAKAVARGIEADFRVADARELAGFHADFDTIIDSGLFHVLGRKSDRQKYANSLRRACRQGGTLYLLAFKAHENGCVRWVAGMNASLRRVLKGFGTHGVSEKELQAAFREGWKIEYIGQRVEGNFPFCLAHIRRV